MAKKKNKVAYLQIPILLGELDWLKEYENSHVNPNHRSHLGRRRISGLISHMHHIDEIVNNKDRATVVSIVDNLHKYIPGFLKRLTRKEYEAFHKYVRKLYIHTIIKVSE